MLDLKHKNTLKQAQMETSIKKKRVEVIHIRDAIPIIFFQFSFFHIH